MKQIFWVLILVVVVIFGAIWFGHRLKAHALSSGKVVARNQAAAISSPGTPATPPDGQKSQPAQSVAASPSTTPAGNAALTPPTADSIRRDPPSGAVFAGKGKFQLYRQGDITWRLDTDSGTACILFATDTQWRKPQVYSHGCGPA
ncbi:MAG: hypothetical protein ABR889_03195 [Acidobacteriaceae bacterium]|jgi:hypothetical protein